AVGGACYVVVCSCGILFFFSSRRRHTGCSRDWSFRLCSSDLECTNMSCIPMLMSFTSPGVKLISIGMHDMLVHSWAGDYQALQAVDLPMSADTSVAVPELSRLCRELLGNDGKKKAAIEARQKELAEKHSSRRAKWLADAQAKGSQKEISTAWLALELGEVIRKEDWVLVNGSSN